MRILSLPYPALPNKLYSKALIKVGYACNSDCLFCHVDQYRGAKKSERAIVYHKMAQIKAKGFDMVCLSGGEVTIRQEFMDWVRGAHSLGLLVGLVTNGRRLSEPSYTRELYRLGLRYAYVSFYGATAEVHNYIAGGMDCWQEQIDGVRNLAALPDVDLTLNVVMCKQNLPELRGIIDLFADIPHLRIKFSLMEPKGSAEAHYADICPPISEAAAAALDAIRYGEELARERGNLTFGLDGVPPCLVGDEFHAAHHDNLMTHGIYYMTETWEKRFFHVDDLNKKHLEPCLSCSLAHRCPGVPVGYEGTAEAAGLLPLHEAPSAGPLLEPVGEPVLWPVGSQCPVLAGALPMPTAPGAALLLERHTLQPYRTQSPVSGGEWRFLLENTLLERVTAEGSQPLRPAAACVECPHSLVCNNAWQVSPTAVAPEPPTAIPAPRQDWDRVLAERQDLSLLRHELRKGQRLLAEGSLPTARLVAPGCSPPAVPVPALRWVGSQEVLIELEVAGWRIVEHLPAGRLPGGRWRLTAEPLPYRRSRPLQSPEVQTIIPEEVR